MREKSPRRVNNQSIPQDRVSVAFDMAANFFQARAPSKKKQVKETEHIPNPSLKPWVEK